MNRAFLLLLLSLAIVSCSVSKEKYKKKYSDREESLLSNKYDNVWELNPLFSYEEALIKAKNRNEKILVLFTGINNSGNPSKIFKLLNSNRIATKIQDNYIICLLFLDVAYKLSDDDDKTMKEINTSLQNKLIDRTDTHNFVKINSDGEIISESFNCLRCSEDELLDFLNSGL